MSARIEGNKIVIPIEVVMEDKQEWREIMQQAQQLQQSPEVNQTQLAEAVMGPRYEPLDFAREEYEQDPEFYDTLREVIQDDIADAVDDALSAKTPSRLLDIDTQDFRKVASFATNPEGTILSTITRFAPQVAAILAIPALAEYVAEYLTGPGGPLDLRSKLARKIEDLMRRSEKQQRRIGLKQVIITSTNGFRSLNGANAGNTFSQIRETGTANVGLYDKASGWRP